MKRLPAPWTLLLAAALAAVNPIGLPQLQAQQIQIRANRVVVAGAARPVPVENATPSDAIDEPALPTSTAIYLRNGDFAVGQLAPSTGPDTLAWNAPLFSHSLNFPLINVESVRFSKADKPDPPVQTDNADNPLAKFLQNRLNIQPNDNQEPSERYTLELNSGDVVTGTLLGLDQKHITVDVPTLGRLPFDRTAVHRMYRHADGGGLLYLGPGGTDDWQFLTDKSDWREDAGALVTDRDGAAIQRDFSGSNATAFEFEIAWSKKADFTIILGVEPEPPKLEPNVRRRQPQQQTSTVTAFRFEVWGDQLVLARENETLADIVPIQKLPTGAGRIQLLAYTDDVTGQILLYSAKGELLADMTVPPAEKQQDTRFLLKNNSGDVRLERLRVVRWNGQTPNPKDPGEARIVQTDDDPLEGHILAFNPKDRTFQIEVAGAQQTLPEDKVLEIALGNTKDESSASIRAVTNDGMRFSGQLQQVQPNKIILRTSSLEQPLSLPVPALASLVILKAGDGTISAAGKRGVLQADGVRLTGSLADADNSDGRCLKWHPSQASAAVNFADNASARIVYRDPKPQPTTTPTATRVTVPARRVGVAQIINNIIGVRTVYPSATAEKPQTPARAENAVHVLHLRSGDIVPCKVISIDDKGVAIKTDVTDATFIPHQQIQALELMPQVQPVGIAKPKKDRLLTLPRMQKDSPPTHLLRSTQGDYLRCRLIGMDNRHAQVELRLENQSIPRDSIARILWLHNDGDPDHGFEIGPDGDPQPKPRTPAPNAANHLVQALLRDGNRITFEPQKVEGGTISGLSESLGTCHVDLAQTDILFIGKAIEEAAATLAFHQWKLQDAPEPLSPEESSEGGGDGIASPLVGKPAPEFELKLLDGKSFRPADYKNQVLVLDFWASWCGPCLQAMPQIHSVAAEFAQHGVKLVAVNLQETPDAARAALQRLGLDMDVAMDEDGLVAEMYGATAIPQTVIIDKDGSVARVFVGGGSTFDEKLRTALQTVLGQEEK